MPERKFSVSADASSLTGTPRQWREVWEPALKHQNFSGFEMIGWRWSPAFLKEANKMGLEVVGVHGRIGDKYDHLSYVNGVGLGVLNSLLVPTPKLISIFGGSLPYILVHSPEARSVGRGKINALFLENNPHVGSLKETTDKVKQFRQSGINAGIMFDMFHFSAECDLGKNRGAGFEGVWHEIIRNLDSLLEQQDEDGIKIPVAIHLPLGPNKIDSLPVEQISPEMWKNLASHLNDVLVVIENQQRFPNNLYSTTKSRKLQAERNSRILEVLDSNGVI